MAWKKDLENLKKTFGAEEPKPQKPPPKPKPTESRPIEDEDAVFLSAMGHRTQPKPVTPASPAVPAPTKPVPPAEAPVNEFASAMGDLKGIVAIRAMVPTVQAKVPPTAPAQTPVVPATPPSGAKDPEPASEAVPPASQAIPPTSQAAQPIPPAAPADKASATTLHPVQINLAAGMAIEVDGSLDLKGHGRNDAEERLKERILDGHALGWRSVHVVLGPSEDLRQMLLELLESPCGSRIARYAQAPIPMGGSQAWILYFRSLLPPSEAN